MLCQRRFVAVFPRPHGGPIERDAIAQPVDLRVRVSLRRPHHEAHPALSLMKDLSASRRQVEVSSLVPFLPRVQSVQRGERNLDVVALRGDEMKSVALHPVRRNREG